MAQCKLLNSFLRRRDYGLGKELYYIYRHAVTLLPTEGVPELVIDPMYCPLWNEQTQNPRESSVDSCCQVSIDWLQTWQLEGLGWSWRESWVLDPTLCLTLLCIPRKHSGLVARCVEWDHLVDRGGPMWIRTSLSLFHSSSFQSLFFQLLSYLQMKRRAITSSTVNKLQP